MPAPPVFTYSVSPDGVEVTLTRRDLPAVADERHYAVTATYDELAEIMAAMEKAQTVIKHTDTRDGDL